MYDLPVRQKVVILSGIMLGVLLAAVDQTIVAPVSLTSVSAIPEITGGTQSPTAVD